MAPIDPSLCNCQCDPFTYVDDDGIKQGNCIRYDFAIIVSNGFIWDVKMVWKHKKFYFITFAISVPMEKQNGVIYQPNNMYVKTHYHQVGGHTGAEQGNGHT